SMRRSAGATIAAAKRIVSVKCLIVRQLTGVWIEDHGIASSSGLFNVQDGCWDAELLGILDLGVDHMPPIASRDAVVGHITARAANEFGLTEGIPVVNGTGDGFTANIGADAESSDKICITLGTSAVARQTLSRPVLAVDGGTFCYRADENAYLLGCA